MTHPSQTSKKSMRLLAEDADDLRVVSAAVQDAVLQAKDISWTPSKRRLLLELNRFRYEAPPSKDKTYERVRAGLSFDGVLSVKAKHMPSPKSTDVRQLLSIAFEAGDPPGGVIRLIFAGGGEMRLDVEVLDVRLVDTETVWPTRRKPRHGGA